jgi:hypothetical protein
VQTKPVSGGESDRARQLESIEDILDQLDGGDIESAQAVAFLKKVV